MRLAGPTRALVLAAAAAAAVLPFGRLDGAAGAATGALVGALLAELAAARHLRPTAVGVAGGLLALGLVGLAGLLGWLARLPTWLDDASALRGRELATWAALALALVLPLHACARRWRWAAALEVAIAAAALVGPLAAHRDGMLHRPLALGDLAAARDLDPARLLRAIGALGAGALGLLLVRPGARWRTAHALGLATAVLLGWLAAERLGSAPPAASADLGLTGREAPRGGDGDGAAGEASRGGARAPDLDTFRDRYDTRGDDAPVAVVVLHADHEPPGGVFYLRQSVLSQLEGTRLVRAVRGDADRDVALRFPAARLALEPAGGDEGRVTVPTRVGLLAEHVQPFALDTPSWIEPVPNPAPGRFLRTYRASSRALASEPRSWLGRRAGSPGWSAALWRHYTVSTGDDRYARLAREITGELRPEHAADPLARAWAIRSWLAREASYSRDSRHAHAPDPTASFLFGDRVGYCVHFAHAAARLIRALGLPARVAMGYAVPAHARAGGSALLIRGANAHAWAELHLEGLGWIPIDPSPARALESAASPPDPELQRRLGELLRREPAPEQRLEIAGGSSGQVRTAAAGLALATLWLGGVLLGALRPLAVRLTPRSRLPRAAFREAARALAALGERRHHGETPERFAARVAARAPSFAALTQLHLRHALGRGPAPRRAEVLARLSAVRLELRASTPLWRRWAARLHPLPAGPDPARRSR